MDLTFASRELEDVCNDDKTAKKKLGAERAKRLRRRLDDLRAAPTLEVMRNLPGRTHELVGDMAGKLSIDLDGPYRLIFEPVASTQTATGGLDWQSVRAIRMLKIEDTHD